MLKLTYNMATKFERFQKRRLLSSYFSVVLSIGLVLFLLGILGLLVINSKKITDHFKERIAVTVYFKENAKSIEIDQLEKSLKFNDAVKHTLFISKEKAAATFAKDIGEDFIEFIGTNPLQNSLDVYLKADFVNETQVADFVAMLGEKKFVDEVNYDKPLINLLNNNIKKISFWILVISGLCTLIAVLLINNSIRLSVYAKRFTIKTMQMVGATKSFIRKPFIWLNIKLGILGGILACAGMGAVLYYLNLSFLELNLLDNPTWIALLFAGIFVLGLLITWVSTFLATHRFLSLQTDELYY